MAACILCGAGERESVLEVSVPCADALQLFRLLRCRACGLVATDPQLSSQILEAHYDSGYWGRSSPDNLDWVRRDQRPRTDFLYRFAPRGRVLDVGCGLRLFLLALDPVQWDRWGVEAMPLPHAQASQRLGADRILRGELITAALPEAPFDVITFWDVLEHLPNPRAALERAFRLLRPGGRVLLSLPNFAGWQARHFGADWYALSLPHHLFHFTPATLQRLLETSGFRLLACEERFGPASYHALKHSLLTRMTRRYGPRAGRLAYYSLKPFLHPLDWIATRTGGGAHQVVCAERPVDAPQ